VFFICLHFDLFVNESGPYAALWQVCTNLYPTYQKVSIDDYQRIKMTKKDKEIALCPVDYAFRRIGGKYKARILWHVHRKKVLRYGELKRTLPDITTKMLTQTLRELEDDILIHRKVFPEVPPKVEYTLTDTGAELIPSIRQLMEWGDKQMKKKKLKVRD
jgi:DNA-binding HxlR family transcriptional regulator